LLKKACRASRGVIYADESWGRLKPAPIDLHSVRCVSAMTPVPRVRR
jgi:hypothetical protein